MELQLSFQNKENKSYQNYQGQNFIDSGYGAEKIQEKNLTAWDRVELSRSSSRPTSMEYIQQVFDEFLFFDKERGLINKIGNDCWLGADVTLIGGVEIKDGAVVLANAVVTKDVPPYAIVGGVPAKIIRYRFSEDVIAKLEELKWWDMPEEDIKTHLPFFQKENIAVEDIEGEFKNV